jgi:hypothetical protein
MRNNEDRFGPPTEEDSGVSSFAKTDSLSFVTPTEFVELPSRGTFYPQGHPLHDQETIEIKFMTAKEEDILTSKALLKKGVAIDRMLQNLILDKSIKLEDMLVGDKNAVLIASRISAYGSDYAVQVICPSCETKQKFQFDLNALNHKECSTPEEENVSITERGTFKTTLPKSKVELEFRLLKVADETRISQDLIKKKEGDDNSTKQLKMLVVSVAGHVDPTIKRDFIDNMPAIDARHVRLLLRKLSPDIDMSQEFTCESCGFQEEMEIPLTQEFFWPK